MGNPGATNRLAASTSPYLLQHQHNPVDWWEWTPEAFAEAERRGVPVLLSVGYAACHWCHVMAHESFEDAAIADVMNANFVNIKVDREERPDVDAVYMEAVQAMTGHGGWPMTAFLTARGEPFFCGTYWPPQARHGMPGFLEVLASVTQAWTTRRDEVEAAGAEVVRQLGGRPQRDVAGAVTADLLDRAAGALRTTYDAVNGGFGTAPKFPPSMVLEFLLRRAARTQGEGLDLVAGTCEAMARGGMYDQLAGGFARYSVDAGWVVPHFEKMLYDNALLLRVYTHWWRATGSPTARRVALETGDFLLRDLLTPEGGFASALDADTDGVEGATYAWTPEQLTEVLGPDDGRWAATQFSVTESGTFEHGTSVLQRREDPGDSGRYEAVRTRLLAARQTRAQPARDDKVVTAWNGLAIAALAEGGALLDRPDWVAAAGRCADLLRRVHWVDGRLLRTSRDGVAGRHAGVLEDYADLAEGLLALHQVTGEPATLLDAGELLAVILTRFSDGVGGFFDTADDAERLVRRPQDPTDNAVPSGASAAAGALLTYAALTGSEPHRSAAENMIGTVAAILGRHVRFAGWSAAVAEALLAGPLQVAVVDRPDLLAVARRATSPGAVVTAAGPLVADRPSGAAYVCRGFVCDSPTTDAARLRSQLGVTVD
ncbi:MAG TPA: thioredoxin domain-containing protein [Mycobacteriales bacterium]|nr:thioredoxin domain-containing protein [Mycobacteriales bacterium]